MLAHIINDGERFGEKMKNKIKFKALTAILLATLMLMTINVFAVNACVVADVRDDVPLFADRTNSVENGNTAMCGYNVENLMLYPGGMPFGVKIRTAGATIIGLSEFCSDNVKQKPAKEAGIKEKDIITKINGLEIGGVKDAVKRIEDCNGENMIITVKRSDTELDLSVIPKKDDSDGKYKIGVWIKDSTAGIGTVTFIVPESYIFGGLGHGICDSENGSLIPVLRGSISDVTISGIIKGECGKPGEIRGSIGEKNIGTLISNTECGAYGVFSEKPDMASREPMPVASKGDIKEGPATIISTLENGKTEEYGIEIFDINESSDAMTKNFMVKVTDPRLIEKSGGIVQGMSGSPIIQNGKIIGAVTHVLISDPTIGYGIFIENMLSNAPQAVQ